MPDVQQDKPEKKWVRKLLMVPIVAGIVIAGVAFGLPLVFATKKEPVEIPPAEDEHEEHIETSSVHDG
ncbi:MAG TPA: hypothetical protein VKY31_02640 [Terriglobia bacterium]|nr:hypothetical protein [Terriglobia bacterium]